MATTLQDLRYATRLLLRTPGFAVVAVLTLALGIGANTAIFTVVNALLLKPLPYAHPDRLVMVWQDFRARSGPIDEWGTPGNYVDWRAQTEVFEEIAMIGGWRPTLTGGPEAEPLAGEQVTHEYFSVLGVAPVLGRNFSADDDVPKAPRVTIISDQLWKRRFGGQASALGQTITLSGVPHDIVGVLPAGFRPIIAGAAELWRPMQLNTATPSRGAITLRSIARLPEGVSVDRAQVLATALARQLETQYPKSNEKVGFHLTPLHARVVGDIKPGLLALLGAVAFVLLIACANIANLLLARGSARGRELAVRLSLGAARGRVIRQLLTESILLAAVGGILGMLLGVWAVDALIAIAPADAPRVSEIRLDLTVFAFAALLTIVTGVLFGLVPALHSSRADVTRALKDGSRGSSAAGGRQIRRSLIVAEVALALMLLTGGGLLLQTFVHLQQADLGFNPEGLLVGAVNPPNASYNTPARHLAFYDQVLEKASTLPGVRKAALASVLPLSGDSDTNFLIEGRPAPRTSSETPVTWYRLVSASYFDTMGMQLRRGRAFERREAMPSVVVNETMAKKFFPGEDPIGHRINLGGEGTQWFTIIGVAADARARGAREAPKVETFVPYWQLTEPGMVVVLKTDGNPTQLTSSLKQVVAGIDRNVPIANVTTLATMVGESIEQPRFFATLAAAFAFLALVLAAIGIYGVMAYAVEQRTMEIGVRMALGAKPSEVFRLVVADGLKLTALGIGVGLAGSIVLARWLRTLLFGVAPGDPLTLAATAGVLLLVAAVACYIPARRATRVDPMVALRT
ncbi:MAG: ABC transporter permease [Vicinamibacterales bacterium]